MMGARERSSQGAITFWIAAGLFLVGAILGAALAGSLGHVLTPLVQSVRKEAVSMKSQSAWATEWMLFANNWTVSLYMLVGGLFFGLLPILGVVMNGALVGYVVRQLAVSAHANPVVIVLAGIVPHGIFEIPAYCLASGFGMRLGWLVWRTITKRADRATWKRTVYAAVPTLLWVTGLLFVAAFIESHITPVLLRLALGHA
ncbi:MAG: stage II sporulation protein M [Firmicutes bacterium]|nr:stage II sporulation protein M [Bacillota bacterium]